MSLRTGSKRNSRFLLSSKQELTIERLSLMKEEIEILIELLDLGKENQEWISLSLREKLAARMFKCYPLKNSQTSLKN